MEREVRYCTTEDGVNIAYCVEGDGPTTILALPAFYESFSLDHLMPVYQQFYRDLGKGRRVIRFDWRGTGLSANVPPGIEAVGNLLAGLADISAVARAAGQPCVVWAPTIAGIPGIDFAAARPDLVTHLILYGTYASVPDTFSHELLESFRSLARVNWDMAMQTVADTNGRREYPEEAGQLGEWYAQSILRETYLDATDPEREGSSRSVTSLLSQVHLPSLVLHRIADPIIPFAGGQKLAAGIPGARFVPLEGRGHLFCLGDYSKILTAVDDFLGDREKSGPASARGASAFRTVLFTDLVGHTEMMSRLGDAKGRDVLREHERITREVLAANGGTEVKTMGDGFMASFGSVTKAVECAVALQRAVDEWNRGVGAQQPPDSLLNADRHREVAAPLRVRVGLNAGEPIEEDGDLFGATVILASRIAAKAGGGEILVADTVRGLCSGKGFLFADRGEFVAKGIEEPVRVSEVRWAE